MGLRGEALTALAAREYKPPPAYHVPLIDLDKVPTPTSARFESEEDDGPASVDLEDGEGRVTMTPIGLIQYRRREVPKKVVNCEFCRKKSRS